MPPVGATRTRTERLGAAIFGLLLGIFALRAFVDTPGLSLVFLAVFPIVMAAFVLGRTAALVAAVIATVLSIVVPIINPATDVSTGAQIVGAVGRAAVYIGLALLVSSLLERETSCASPWRSQSASARAREPARGAHRARTARGRRHPDRHLLHAGRRAGGRRLLPRHPRPQNSTLVVVGDVVGHPLRRRRPGSTSAA